MEITLYHHHGDGDAAPSPLDDLWPVPRIPVPPAVRRVADVLDGQTLSLAAAAHQLQTALDRTMERTDPTYQQLEIRVHRDTGDIALWYDRRWDDVPARMHRRCYGFTVIIRFREVNHDDRP